MEDDVGAGLFCTLGSTLGDGEEVIFGAALTTTPLFHTIFFPDLIQVNNVPFDTCFMPTFGHGSPTFGAAACEL